MAEVKFPFVARSRDEMSLSKNTIIRLAPKGRQPNIKGWLLASDGENQGLVPANYIKVMFSFSFVNFEVKEAFFIQHIRVLHNSLYLTRFSRSNLDPRGTLPRVSSPS